MALSILRNGMIFCKNVSNKSVVLKSLLKSAKMDTNRRLVSVFKFFNDNVCVPFKKFDLITV